MKLQHFVVMAAAVFSAAGCASAIEGTTQPIAIATAPENGATCVVSNMQGQWSVVTPGAVVIQKSESALTIRCNKPGWQEAKIYAASRLSKAAMVGALLPYVGILNAAVDGSSGAASEYAAAFTLTMKPIALPVLAAPKKPPPASG